MSAAGDLARALVAVVLLAGCSPRPLADGDPAVPSPIPSPPRQSAIPAVPPNAEQDRLNMQLIEAAWKNDLATAERLVAAGADVNYKDSTMQSAFLIATSEGYLELLDFALRSGALVNDKDSFNGTGLIRAADRGHAEVASRLVRAGIDLDHVNRLGWTALLEAVILGRGEAAHEEIVRILLDAGADPNLTDRNGVTALQHARVRGYNRIAAILERAGAR